MVHFVGAGSGAEDLITLRGARLLETADQIIYAGSLVNPELLKRAKADCQLYDSARLTLEQILDLIRKAEAEGKMTVRLHTGDPSLFGAVAEQYAALEAMGIPYAVCPGVSSFCGAAAALGREYTLPGVSQTLILTRLPGRTEVPARESLRSLAAHGSSIALFLSTGLAEQAQRELLAGGYPPETPAALVYKATWPEERIWRCPLSDLAGTVAAAGIQGTALLLVGRFLAEWGERSRLYAPEFSTLFREAEL